MSNEDTTRFPEYEQEYAYSAGIQLMTFGKPLLVFERERKVRLAPFFKGQKGIAPVARINDIGHMHTPATCDDILPYTPNNDTIYSGSIIELIDEPIVLTAPTILDRYWSVELADCYTENIAYIGSRATNGEGGDFILVGPNYTGDLPEGENVTHIRLDYNSCMFALRIGVTKGSKIREGIDLWHIHKLQEQFHLTSLTNWKNGHLGKADVPKSVKDRPEYTGDLANFQTLADLFIENPPIAKHDAQIKPFEYIGLKVGEKFDVDALSEPTKIGLARAAEMAENIFSWKVKYRGIPFTTRWNMLQEGRYEYKYLDRAAGSFEGLFVHDYVEAIYYSTYESCNLDEDGNPDGGEFFNSSNKYVMTIDKKNIPKVNQAQNGFWSLTMYGPDFQLVANEIRRFAVSDSTLVPDSDGNYTVYIQATNPDEDPTVNDVNAYANWLPCPPDGGQLFRVNYRQYLPLFQTRHPVPKNRFAPPITLRN